MARDSIPFVPAESKMLELTPRAIILGGLLGVLLGAANVYLGLYAGMTVSASIPAAVLSMGILRGIFRSGTILENNIVQTIAASGEALAAGAIFTIPALLLVGVWKDIPFWPSTLICLCGGLLGICFMIPLRRSHIVEDKTLTYPEGVACAEVLKAGEADASGAKYVLISLAVGCLFKFLSAGVSIFKGTVDWAFRLGSTPLYFGTDISAALLAVGYIVGINVGINALIGGVIAWMVAIPLSGGAPQEGLLDWFWMTWSTKARFLGVGGMLVAGIWSVLNIRASIVRGFSEALAGYKKGNLESGNIPRTEQNMAGTHIVALLVITCLATAGLYHYLTESFGLTVMITIIMVILSFFFVAVGSYICGLLGSSTSPVSGMTICALMITATLLMIAGLTGDKAIIATLGVAGVVCVAISSAGDISQDLKTGYLLGATPKAQQWMEIVGVAIPAVIVAPVITILHHSYGIGTGQPGSLKAPQAALFASVTKGFFGDGQIPWNYVSMGVVLGIVIVILDAILKARRSAFRMPVMAVAVGMYLPLTLSVPIALGGLIAASIQNRAETGKGVLFASGLIAGEAIMGVLIGAVIYFNKGALPITIVESDLVSLAGFFILGSVLYLVAKTRG